MKRLLCLCALLLCASGAAAQQVTTGASTATVSVTSAAAGTQLCSTVRYGCRVMVPATAASPVCVSYVDVGTTCAAGLTNPATATCILPANGWETLAYVDRWNGQVCGILLTGTTPVLVSVQRW